MLAHDAASATSLHALCNDCLRACASCRRRKRMERMIDQHGLGGCATRIPVSGRGVSSVVHVPRVDGGCVSCALLGTDPLRSIASMASLRVCARVVSCFASCIVLLTVARRRVSCGFARRCPLIHRSHHIAACVHVLRVCARVVSCCASCIVPMAVARHCVSCGFARRCPLIRRSHRAL